MLFIYSGKLDELHPRFCHLRTCDHCRVIRIRSEKLCDLLKHLIHLLGVFDHERPHLAKERDATLTSQTYGYESNVSYWMPITWTGIGLHDASWRGSFGGSIYLSNGSHGCVNLPTETARALFEADTMDMPVIIHY